MPAAADFGPLLSVRRLIILIAIVLIKILVLPVVAQSDQIDRVTVQITCSNADGATLSSGIASMQIGESPDIALRDNDTSVSTCARLAIEVLMQHIDVDDYLQLLRDSDMPVSLATATPVPTITTEPSTTPEPTLAADVEPTPMPPTGPLDDIALECENREALSNGLRVQAMLPPGNYRVVLLPVRFQILDPMLVVDTGVERICNTESALARGYVADFSRAEIGIQVYGNQSGNSVDFEILGDPDSLNPVDMILGGRDRSDVGINGDFILLLEGARLTPQVREHSFTIGINESMYNADRPLGVVVLGVSDSLDPNLRAEMRSESGAPLLLYSCEDAGQAECFSDARGSLAGSSVVEAAVRTVRGDDLDAAIVQNPSLFLAQGVQEVTYVVSEVQDQTIGREEYIIAFYGGI